MNAIEARALRKVYSNGHVAVPKLDLDVPRGEVFGLIGPNGAGKTTTVRMLTGLTLPTSGTARVVGLQVGKDPQIPLRIGVVWGENLSPEPAWSPVRYLRHFAELYHVEHPAARIRTLLALLRLDESAERPISTLSGGNRRKVEIARALLHEPEVLFLDEPTRELDIPTKRAVWAALAERVSASGLTVFLSSHDAEEIAFLCHRVAVVVEGKVVWTGHTRELASEGGTLSDALLKKMENPPRPDEGRGWRPQQPVA